MTNRPIDIGRLLLVVITVFKSESWAEEQGIAMTLAEPKSKAGREGGTEVGMLIHTVIQILM